MTLLEKRIIFTRHLGRLIAFANRRGFDVIAHEVARDRETAIWNSQHCKVMVGRKRCELGRGQHVSNREGHRFKAIGIANSVHINALAVDLYVIEDRKISDMVDHYRVLGEWWEQQFEGAAWGGRFDDMGHFSMMHGGRR